MDGTRKECTIMFSSSQREGINHTFLHNPPSKAPEGKGRVCHSSKIGLFVSSAWLFPLGLWQTWMHPWTFSEHGRGNWGCIFAFLSRAYAQAFSLGPSTSSTVCFTFGHCQVHISEGKQLFEPSCNWFWHLPFKAARSAPSLLQRERSEVGEGMWARTSPCKEASMGHSATVCALSHLPKRGCFLS